MCVYPALLKAYSRIPRPFTKAYFEYSLSVRLAPSRSPGASPAPPLHRALTVSRTRRGGPRPTAASGTQQPVQSRAAVGACAPREVPLRPGAGPPGRGRHVEDGPSPRAASQCASNRIKPHHSLYMYKAALSMAVREPAAGQRAALALPPSRVALPVGWCFSSDGHHGYRHDKIIVLTPRCSSAAQLGDT